MSDLAAFTIANRIAAALRAWGHIGRRNGIRRFDFEARLATVGICDRAFRRVYNSPACPICSDNGLYIPAAWHEVETYLRWYGSKVRPELLAKRRDVMTREYQHLMLQGPLFQSEASYAHPL